MLPIARKDTESEGMDDLFPGWGESDALCGNCIKSAHLLNFVYLYFFFPQGLDHQVFFFFIVRS